MNKNLIVLQTMTLCDSSACRADFGPEDKFGNTSEQGTDSQQIFHPPKFSHRQKSA